MALWQPTDRYASIETLRRALAAAGVAVPSSCSSYADLQPAVEAYQRKVKLTPDGDAGPNVCRQLRANLPTDAGAASRAMRDAVNLYTRLQLTFCALWAANASGIGPAGAAALQRAEALNATGQTLETFAYWAFQAQPAVFSGAAGSWSTPATAAVRATVSEVGAAVLVVPWLVPPMVEGAAGLLVEAVGSAAALGAAAWLGTKAGELAGRLDDAFAGFPALVSVRETIAMRFSKAKDASPGKPFRFDFKEFDWRKYLAIAKRLAAILGAVLVFGMGVVGMLAEIGTAAAGAAFWLWGLILAAGAWVWGSDRQG